MPLAVLPGSGNRRFRRVVRRRDPRRSILRFAVYLLTVLILHTAAMLHFERLGIIDALWVTLTTITTVGYGDVAAKTLPGRASTVLLIYLGGIFVAFQAATTYFEYRLDRRLRMLHGRWRWNMEGHILLLNVPEANPAQYLCRLVGEFRVSRRLRGLPVLVLTDRFDTGLPEPLQEMGVAHYAGRPESPQDLAAAGAARAAAIVVLARHDSDQACDGHTFDILHRLREQGVKGRILVESVADANRDRLRQAGAEIVIRPLRGYPEMIVRALLAPGSEYIIEDLFISKGEECWRYDVDIDGRRWMDIVRVLVEADIGVPIAYRSTESGKPHINPPPATLVYADKLYVIVREGNNRPDAEVERLLKRCPQLD